ncbi:unnamed protein product [Medioppia subpectinata]|uniref:glutathione transferase n=1 Tax=Medioppia subpectinata TaxID=1979941 RepID=A0A7R9PTR4_9ACAR|nr:unnamed protein product [Medioppia subpectinata]CAG2100927.1 unnamed protein product [Medioppia subpectinata]
MSNTTTPTLGYYRLQGIAQPIRLLLAYTGTAYTDKQYDYGLTADTYRVHWLKDKFTLGLEFPNLPYYLDGDVRLTQSHAIMRYVGRRHGLVATDETGLVRQDMLEQQLVDIRVAFAMGVPFSWGNNFTADKAKYINDTLPPQLAQLSRFLGDNQWFTGRNINYVDFLAYQQLDWLRQLSPETLATVWTESDMGAQ